MPKSKNVLKKHFPRRWKIFKRALSNDKRRIRQLVSWKIAYPDKILPSACTEWSEQQFRLWAGQEEQPEKKEEEIDLDTIEDSLLECPKCHLRKVDHFGKQTRSADEPETIFAHCLACGHRWRQ